MELEGLRGIAAIVVVFHHFFLAFLPSLVFGSSAPQHMRYEDNIYGTPLDIVYAGTFAVAIFFVLSGFVLSIGYFRSHDNGVIKKLAERRYFRLMLPALTATICCFLLISLGVPKLIGVASTVTASTWLSGTWGFDTNIFHAFYSGTVGIFLSGHSPYDNVLWTMKTEFLGSFLVFGSLFLFAKSKNRWLVYLMLCIFTFNTWYFAFVIGVLLADCYAVGLLHKIKPTPILVGSLAVGALLLGAYPPFGDVSKTMYGVLNIHIPGLKVNYEVLYLTVGAAMLILAVLLSKRIKALLKVPRVSALGKYTYSLYLTHLMVIYTLSTAIFIHLHDMIGYNKAVLVTAILSAPVIGVVSYLFMRYVDEPSIRFAKNFMYTYATQDIIPMMRQRVAYVTTKVRWSITTMIQVLLLALAIRRPEDEE